MMAGDNRHVQSGLAQRSLPCGKCNRKFRHPIDLQRHARSTGHGSNDTIQNRPQNQNRRPGAHIHDTGTTQPRTQRTNANHRKAHNGQPPPPNNVDMSKRMYEEGGEGALSSKKSRWVQEKINRTHSLAQKPYHIHNDRAYSADSAPVTGGSAVSTQPSSTTTLRGSPHYGRVRSTVSYSPHTHATPNTHSTPPKQTSNVTFSASRQNARLLQPNSISAKSKMYQDFFRSRLPVDLLPVYYTSSAKTDPQPSIQPHVESVWTQLDPPDYEQAWEALSSKRHSHTQLEKSKYRLTPYSEFEMSLQRKCKNCIGKAKYHNTVERRKCVYHPQKDFSWNDKKEKIFTCCGKTSPCKRLPQHDYLELDDQTRGHFQSFVETVSHFTPHKRRAVVVDCEMVGVLGYRSEPVRLGAVDYFTGEILIDAFIQPDKPVVDWRTKYSGVNAEIMREAHAQGKVMPDWQTARHALYDFVDDDTVIVGQALHHDLDVLRMIHTHIVDSCLLPKDAAAGINRTWSLKSLCSELFGIKVQNHGKKGHDPVEDCMATREIVLWMTGKPEEFKKWGAIKLEEEKQRLEEQKKKVLEQRAKKAAEEAKKRDAENGKASSTDVVIVPRRREMLLDLGFPEESLGAGLVY